VDEALDYSGDDIIKAIQKRYPQTNYIRVRGKNGWNKKLVDNKVWVRTVEYCWKIVWIQQTQNALDRDTVVRSLSKDMPGTQIMKRSLDDQEVSDTATQFVAVWGEFHPPALRESARKKLKVEQSVSDMSDEDIARLVQENIRLKKEVAVASANSHNITLKSMVNSNNTTNNNTTNTTNIIVNVGTPYGFEVNNHVTPEQWKSIIAEGIQKGLAHLTCQTIDVIHSVDENKNFYMTQPNSENVKVLRHGNVYEDVLLEKFARDAPYHYAEIVKEASNEDACAIGAIDNLTRDWAADRNRKLSNQKVMRKVQKKALEASPGKLLVNGV
jgi:hypothetical protein